MDVFWQSIWVVCGIATLGAALLAGRSSRARLAGRSAVGVLFTVGGALLHVVNLSTDVSYAEFADPALFGWVTDAWHAVVAPHQVLFIGLLVLFEATAGILVLSGGRRTQFGYAAVIGFYLALWLFGWIETVWGLLMLPAMVALLRAETTASRLGSPAASELAAAGPT